MRRETIKLLIFSGAVAFAVLYGMELASTGIASVNGPWDSRERAAEASSSPFVRSEDEWTLPARSEHSRSASSSDSGAETAPFEEEGLIPRNDRRPIVDRVSGKTAEALHSISHNGIRFVVSLFEKATGS